MNHESKICINCHILKPFEDFHKCVAMKTGRINVCKKCSLARLTEQRKNPAFRERFKKYQRTSSLRLRYGISDADYEKMVKKQKNKCPICGEEPRKTKAFQTWHLHVDHCHKTNKVRGLLCHLCNRGLGLFRENKDLLKKAARYLKKHEI